MIALAQKKDIDDVEKIFIDIGEMEENNTSVTQWKKGVYPVRTTAENALCKDTLYILKDSNHKICGCVILNYEQLEEYKEVLWGYEAQEQEVLVIHTLCISPEAIGQGYAKKILIFADDIAREKKCKTIRLETGIYNTPAKKLYNSYGYETRGTGFILKEDSSVVEVVYFDREIEKIV